MQLAQTYLNLERWQLAITAADKTLFRQGEQNDNSQTATMFLVKGMVSFNLKKYESAKLVFTQAQKYSQVKKTAQQRFLYVERERGQAARLAMRSKINS